MREILRGAALSWNLLRQYLTLKVKPNVIALNNEEKN